MRYALVAWMLALSHYSLALAQSADASYFPLQVGNKWSHSDGNSIEVQDSLTVLGNLHFIVLLAEIHVCI